MIQCLRFESTVMIQIALNRIDCMLMSLDHEKVIDWLLKKYLLVYERGRTILNVNLI